MPEKIKYYSVNQENKAPPPESSHDWIISPAYPWS